MELLTNPAEMRNFIGGIKFFKIADVIGGGIARQDRLLAGIKFPPKVMFGGGLGCPVLGYGVVIIDVAVVAAQIFVLVHDGPRLLPDEIFCTDHFTSIQMSFSRDIGIKMRYG